MNILAFDTSTERLSVAVGRDLTGAAAQLWTHDGPGGAQASTGLIPSISRLLQQAGLQLRDLEAIAFGAGPGSFTGLRTACSVAQGLGFAAGRPLLPVDSLLALAQEALLQRPAAGPSLRVLAALDARMDEIYVGGYEWDGTAWSTLRAAELVRPQDLHLPPGWLLAGNVAAAYGAHCGEMAVVDALPTARALLELAPGLLRAGLGVSAEHAAPRYVRDKVAKTTAERLADKLAANAVAG